MKRPNGMTPERLSGMFSLALHFQGVGNASKSDYDALGEVLRTNNMSVSQLTAMLAPKCDEILHVCKWKGTMTRCEGLFQPVNTSEGVCCSFNYYGLKSNNFHTYVNSRRSMIIKFKIHLLFFSRTRKISQSRSPKPHRVTASGPQTGITVMLNPLIHDYHTTFFSSYGFRVFIHDAYDFLDDNSETKTLGLTTIALLSVTPESTYSTADVRSLPIHARQCLMPDEKKLNVMQSYSFINCMADCRSDVVFSLCGCVPYHMLNNGTYPVCEMNKITCVIENQHVFGGAMPGLNRSQAGMGLARNMKYSCDCLPDCEFNLFASEVTTAALNRSFSFSNNAF